MDSHTEMAVIRLHMVSPSNQAPYTLEELARLGGVSPALAQRHVDEGLIETIAVIHELQRQIDELKAELGCGRSRNELTQLSGKLGEPHQFAAVDVVRDDEVAAWTKTVLTSFGAPDLLLNNAAIINRSAPLWKVPAQEFSDVIDVNIKGVTNVLCHFIPAMIDRGSGVIVNFSSGWGRSTSAEVAPYCATKFAIEGLTQALAQELPAGLAAIPLNPGIIDTDMLRSCFGGSASSYPSPQQWAKRAVPFLLKLSPRENGQPLTVS